MGIGKEGGQWPKERGQGCISIDGALKIFHEVADRRPSSMSNPPFLTRGNFISLGLPYGEDVLQCCVKCQFSFQGQFLVLDGKQSQGRLVDSQVLMTIFLELLFSHYSLMIFLMMLSVILLRMLMVILSTCYLASDLWQQLEFSEVEYDPRDTVD